MSNKKENSLAEGDNKEKASKNNLVDKLKEIDVVGKEEESILKLLQDELNDFKSEELDTKKKEGGVLSNLAEIYRNNKLLKATIVGLNISIIIPEVAIAKNLVGANGSMLELKSSDSLNSATKLLLEQLKIGKVDKNLLNAQISSVDVDNVEANKIEEKQGYKSDEEGANTQEMRAVIDAVLQHKKYQEKLVERYGEDGAREYINKIKEQEDRIIGPNGEDWYNEEDVKKGVIVNEQRNSSDFRLDKSKKYTVEHTRKEVMQHIGSEDYLNKLTKEFNGDENRARKEQKKRVNRVKNAEVNIKAERTSGEIYNMLRRQANGNIPKNIVGKERRKILTNIVEYYKKYFARRELYGFSIFDNSEKIYIFKDTPKGEKFDNSIRHEFLHSSTRGDKNISEKVKNILSETFRSSNRRKERVMNDYLLGSSERLVRKQQLDYQLEEYGIKKYGEKFTRKHYDAIMQMYNIGAFSEDVEQFIRTTKPDYKTFKEIFDEIAKNEDEKKQQEGTV